MDSLYSGPVRSAHQIQFKPFGELLVESGVITQPQLEAALLAQHQEAARSGIWRVLGVVIAEQTGVTLEVIEDLFVRSYLIGAVDQALSEAFQRDTMLEKKLKQAGTTLAELLIDASISVPRWQVEKAFCFEERDGKAVALETVILRGVTGELVFMLHLTGERTIRRTAPFSYDARTRKLELALPVVLGALRLELVSAVTGAPDPALPATMEHLSEVFLDVNRLMRGYVPEE